MTSRMAKSVLGVLIWAFLTGPAAAGPFSDPAQDGVDRYNEKQYKKALKEFEAARLAEPGNGDVLYNLASTYYQLGSFDHAVEAFTAAEGSLSDPEMKQKAHYNKGNAYYRMGNADAAIREYKKALELAPDDVDAKYNLEFVRRQKERAEQSGRTMPRNMQQEQKPRPGGLNPSTAENQGEQENPENTDPSPQENAGAPDKNPDKADDSTQSAEAQQPNHDPSDPQTSPHNAVPEEQKQAAQALKEVTAMNKDEADRWLNSLKEDLNKMTRRQAQGQMKDLFVEGAKDW